MSAAKHTPAERAMAALTRADLMCQLLAECRSCCVPGWWEGSAFRSHPVGLIVGTIKFTNHWHVDNYCDIEITDGTGWDRNVCRDSFAHASPHPSPIGGLAVRAWRMGAWVSDAMRTALTPRVLQILTEAAEHIDRVTEQRRAEEAAKAEQARQQREATERASIAAATGAQS